MSDLFHARGAPVPPAGRLFALCVALSVALHAATLAFVALHLSLDPAVADPVLSVELAPATMQQSASPMPAVQPAVRERPAERKPAMAAATRSQTVQTAAPPVEAWTSPEPSVPAMVLSGNAMQAPAIAAPAPPRSEPAPAITVAPSFNAAYLNNPRPAYPRLARRNGEEGAALLKVLVTRNGLPGRVELEKTSGSSALDGAALEAVKAWRFVPARKGTEPIEGWVRVPIVFRLVDAS